jgi:hypothetical protein
MTGVISGKSERHLCEVVCTERDEADIL